MGKKYVQKLLLTKNHIFLCIHHFVGPGEGLTQVSHVLWQKQTAVSPAVGRTEMRLITDHYNSRKYC